MLLETFQNSYGVKNNKFLKESQNFNAGYKYWSQILLERAMRLFVWSGADEIGIPAKEIEFALMMNGSAGFTNKYKKTMSVFQGQFCGKPTQYYDIYEDYAVYSPVYSNILKVGKNIEVIDNNACRTSVLPLVNRYAIMLSHVEVSFVNVLINGRESNVAIASTSTQKAAIESYRNSLCNGKVTPILDPAFSGVDFKSVDKNGTLLIKDLMEVRENLLNSFYEDLGVKTAREKKGNMISEEVNANDSMLMLNLSDMLYHRQLGCEKVNKLFGTNLTVDISEELKYNEVVNNTEKEGEDNEL